MMVGGQYSHCKGVPWNDFSFGWNYIAIISVDKQGAEKHVDGWPGNHVDLDSDTERTKAYVEKFFAFHVHGLFGGCL